MSNEGLSDDENRILRSWMQLAIDPSLAEVVAHYGDGTQLSRAVDAHTQGIHNNAILKLGKAKSDGRLDGVQAFAQASLKAQGLLPEQIQYQDEGYSHADFVM